MCRGLFFGLGFGWLCRLLGARRGHIRRRHDAEGQRLPPEADEVEQLYSLRREALACGHQPRLAFGARDGLPVIALGARRVAAQKDLGRVREGPRGVGFGLGQHLEDRLRLGLMDHVGIDDEGVLLGRALAVVLVGADLVVVFGVAAQVDHAEQPHPAHAGLEVIGFVFVGHDADAALLGVGRRVLIGNVVLSLRHQQRLEAEIGLLRVVLFQDADT